MALACSTGRELREKVVTPIFYLRKVLVDFMGPIRSSTLARECLDACDQCRYRVYLPVPDIRVDTGAWEAAEVYVVVLRSESIPSGHLLAVRRAAIRTRDLRAILVEALPDERESWRLLSLGAECTPDTSGHWRRQSSTHREWRRAESNPTSQIRYC